MGRQRGESGAGEPQREVRAVTIRCPKCKAEVELDAKAKMTSCKGCRALLRRCLDCTKYNVTYSTCRVNNAAVDVGEASYPTYSSPSVYCREYDPNEKVLVAA